MIGSPRMRMLTALLLCLLAALPAGATEPLPGSKTVADVVRMLGEGVESGVIERWLAAQEERPEKLTPDDLILLSRAGASEELVRALLDRAGGAGATAPAGPARSRPAGGPAPEVGAIPVAFSLGYRVQWDVSSGEEPWDLYVYLDGEPLASMRTQSGIFRREPLEIDRRLAPGRHVLRLMQERHDRVRRKKQEAWRHEALVCPDLVSFEIDEAHAFELRLEWIEPRFSLARGKGPLTWQLVRDGEPLGGEQNVGTPVTRWPELCDDMEANVAEGQGTPKWVQRNLKGCLRWSELWEGTAPARAEARATLEQHDYRPRAL